MKLLDFSVLEHSQIRCTDFKSSKIILGFFWIFLNFFFLCMNILKIKKDLNTEFEELFTPK